MALRVYDYSNINWHDVAKDIGIKPKRMPVLLSVFLEEFRNNIEKLQKSIEAEDFSEIRLHAHSFKGSCGNMKLTELYKLSKEMEKHAKAHDADYDYRSGAEILRKSIETIKLSD